MKPFRVRDDLTRNHVGAYALPLGVEPIDLPEPSQGYVLDYVLGTDDDPDTYAFQIVVSHERLVPLLRDAFALLPEHVHPVVEVGSRDAYRAMDVFMAIDPIPVEEFLAVWDEYEPFILEDANIGMGANSEEPFIEVFVDTWKGLLMSVPVEMRREVQTLLRRHGLREVAETWPEGLERLDAAPMRPREVLVLDDDECPDLDEVLMQLRQRFTLELNVDPGENLDERGRSLGLTLWNAIAVARRPGRTTVGAYITVWVTAASLDDLEELVMSTVEGLSGWEYEALYSCDRVAFDERPESLNEIAPRRQRAEVHQVVIEEW
ncbi:MAG: hypothetical protein O2800_01725 [Planctomycetota bacterium]|nr:hypothetical protein [Planctomycetota bacterium]